MLDVINTNFIRNTFIVVITAKMMIMSMPAKTGGGEVDMRRINAEPLWKEYVDVTEINELEDFINAIGSLESDNLYHVENRYGMLGRYQFSPTTIKHLGYDVTRDEFLNNPELQDSVMLSYLRENYYTLYDYIEHYDGKTYKGVPINTATVLAGAHFAGAGGMKQFLEDVTDSVGVVDGNGMTLANYMKQFADFNISGV